jgi:hypothetical protein
MGRYCRESVNADGKRKCSKCKEYFTLDHFYKAKNVLDGFRSECISCIKKVKSKRDKRDWAKYKEIHKEELELKRIQREIESAEKKILDKVKRNIREMVRGSVRNNISRPNIQILLGCNIIEFKKYISSLFQEGMTWDNYGYYGWHLDHIKPIASFNLHDINEIKNCFYYTNYQPLWQRDNMKKGSKYNGIRYGKCN